jgi:hypothetical protein
MYSLNEPYLQIEGRKKEGSRQDVDSLIKNVIHSSGKSVLEGLLESVRN